KVKYPECVNLRQFPLAAYPFAVLGVQREPRFRRIAHPLKRGLYLSLLARDFFGVGIRRNVNKRRRDHHHSRSWIWYLHVIPRVGKSVSARNSIGKDVDRPARAARQHHGARLGDETRSARTINGEGYVAAFIKGLRHNRQSAQAAAR